MRASRDALCGSQLISLTEGRGTQSVQEINFNFDLLVAELQTQQTTFVTWAVLTSWSWRR